MSDPRTPLFNALREALQRPLTGDDVAAFNAALDRLGVPRAGQGELKVGKRGMALIQKWEACKLEAYPDPGSADGKPWTIGWGSTGPDIKKGTKWTQAKADERFAQDLEKYAAEVRKAIGDAPTTQSQFDALVSFHYNTGAIARATLTKRHIGGNPEEAAAEFRKWIYNDGKILRGLVRRRAEEMSLYLEDG